MVTLVTQSNITVQSRILKELFSIDWGFILTKNVFKDDVGHGI